MRFLLTALSTLVGIIGLIFILRGGYHPLKYQVVLSENVRAVQVTQIYTEATHSIAVGVGIVSIAVLVAVIGILLHTDQPVNENKESEDNIESDC